MKKIPPTTPSERTSSKVNGDNDYERSGRSDTLSRQLDTPSPLGGAPMQPTKNVTNIYQVEQAAARAAAPTTQEMHADQDAGSRTQAKDTKTCY